MKKENDGFKMWANYVEAIDSYTKGSDEQFGRFMRILCYYGIYGQEIAQTEIEKLFFTGVKSSISFIRDRGRIFQHYLRLSADALSGF